MRINNNVSAMNTHRQYTINNNKVASSVAKLSSGYKINSAADDAAGLAISEKMRAQIRGLEMASKNSQDGVSMVQTAEGALQTTHDILQRMRELAVQSASDTNETSIDRSALDLEFQQLIKEINDTASKTRFNDQNLIDGTFASTTTTAAADSGVAAGAWAASNVEAGDYTLSFDYINETAAVTGEAADSVTNNGLVMTTRTNAEITFSLTAPTGSDPDIANALANGTWKVTYDSTAQTMNLTNEDTGETASFLMSSLEDGEELEIDMGKLGTMTITATGADVALSDITDISGSISVSGAVTAVEATYKYYAQIGSEQIQIQNGQSSLVFKSSGITVDLAETIKNLDATDTNSLESSTIEGDDITVTVSKSYGKNFVLQTGANQGDELSINIERMNAYSLGVASASVSNRLNASNAITQVNTAINSVSTQRAQLGALQNRLEFKIQNLDISAENLTAAESRIRDVDMAKEMTTYMSASILSQASTAMLAQANSLPQNVLSLLG